ncbi:Sec-independent protein translocase subunit TatA/TatB [Parapedobacter sp. 10938]|uniref:Sec-independent protein translocase subunit TatA/TatB n=1 Tax=Parapedobacter flavus TaxID=3110225 RepID=UPI002DB829FD|nr:twin-arginine translocase TatA/TatE family subunit [Parapedobacter sp. 10938]MEC3879566.1 twin-arginine translocase TatA/TatE family subunit [Parapedobacter sp. 10938]
MVDSVLLFLGAQEIILIVLALLLLFGGRKIPELMRGMGRGIREFKEGQKESPKEENPNVPKEELQENKQ